MPEYIVVLGPAGSGKTLLTLSLSDWIRRQNIGCSIINLDPAVESLPYTPDVDVRSYVNARILAEKHGLGPNGALLASMDLLYTKMRELKEEIAEKEQDLNIIDTPGQLELFAYRKTGPLLLDEIVPRDHGVVVFLIDSGFTFSGESLISLLLLSSSIEFRHRLPQINVVTKADLLPAEMIQYIEKLNETPELLLEERMPRGLGSSHILVEAIVERGFKLHLVSSLTEEGIPELYAEIANSLPMSREMETNM